MIFPDMDGDLLGAEKRFYERFYALHDDPQLLAVCKQFGIGVFRRSSVLEGFADFLSANKFGGRLCVEIGTCKGLTALVLARHFEQVISIDIVPDHDRETIAAFCGVTNIGFVTVHDNAEKAGVIRALDFDAAYIDGDHARDTVSDFGLVKRCGRVLFHEFWPAQPPVWDLVNGLKLAGSVVSQGKLALWTA